MSQSLINEVKRLLVEVKALTQLMSTANAEIERMNDRITVIEETYARKRGPKTTIVDTIETHMRAQARAEGDEMPVTEYAADGTAIR